MKNLFFFLSLFLAVSLNAQEFSTQAEVDAVVLGSTGESLPFWFHSNKRGRIDPLTNFSTWANASGIYSLSENSFLRAGLGVLYHDGYNDEIELDQSFLEFQNSWLQIIAGRKQEPELYNDLSATNENILWSLNARPLPGVSIETTRPIIFWKDAGVGFEAELGEYWLGNERYVKGARLHHKSFHFVINPSPQFHLRFGLQHFVQWAGTSPEYGELSGGFNDYLRIFTGQGGGNEIGEQANALGNHLGSYEIYFTTLVNGHKLQFIYNHLFEDGSGRGFGNTPDGRYGIFFRNKRENKLFNSFIYELYYTRNQSRTSFTTDGSDNYFQNQIYASDYTYEGFIIGVPFILYDREFEGIVNNEILVHHFGIGGVVANKLPYKLLLSYRNYYGAKGVSNHHYDVLSTYLDIRVYDGMFNVKLMAGSDFISDDSPVYGAGIHLSKEFF